MRHRHLTSRLSGLMLLLFSLPTLATDNTLTDEEKASGWTLLFDGASAQQWRSYQQQTLSDGWQVADGTLFLAEGGAGDILTKKTYRNFELKLDWKIAEGGNSGIFILADEEGKAIYAHAPEIQILDNERHPDNKLDTHRSGSLYDMVSAHPSAFRPAGEWNTVRIKLDDNLLQVWQNGVMTTNIVIGSGTWEALVKASKFATWDGFGENAEGHIGLQDHGDRVWFKNLKIREW